MKAHAVIRLMFPSERHLAILLKALEPETKRAPTLRSRVQVAGEGSTLTLNFTARDTPALRASINSYLHWIALVNDACIVLESLSKK